MTSARPRARARSPTKKPDIPLGGPPLISGSLPQPARLRGIQIDFKPGANPAC